MCFCSKVYFWKKVLNSDGRLADCRELFIKYIKEGRSESMHPSNNEATIVIIRKIIIWLKCGFCLDGIIMRNDRSERKFTLQSTWNDHCLIYYYCIAYYYCYYAILQLLLLLCNYYFYHHHQYDHYYFTITTITITTTAAAATGTMKQEAGRIAVYTHLAVQCAVCLLTDPHVLGHSRCTNSVLLLTPVTPGSATKFCCSRRRWTAWPVLTRPLLSTTAAAYRRPATWTTRLWIQWSATSTTITVVRMGSLRLLLSFRLYSSSVSFEIIGMTAQNNSLRSFEPNSRRFLLLHWPHRPPPNDFSFRCFATDSSKLVL